MISSDGTNGQDAYAVLIVSEKYFVEMYGCDQGYQLTQIGIDDGMDGAVPETAFYRRQKYGQVQLRVSLLISMMTLSKI